MPVIAIVGAGPGMGRSIALEFGRRGFDVALLSRNGERASQLAADLAAEGITAAGFSADVRDEASLAAAFDAVRHRFGRIDVLEYSPGARREDPAGAMVGPLEVTRDSLMPQLEHILFGAVACVHQVLPEMLERGSGTLMFTTGGGAMRTPNPRMANTHAAGAALHNWVLGLHEALAPRGVHAAHVGIRAMIGSGAPGAEPEVIAREFWRLYESPELAELYYEP